MKEDWAEKLKQKLEGHRVTPPPGLWEGISKQMGLEAEPVGKANAPKRWYWAAVAAVLALVGIFLFQQMNNEQPLQAVITPQQPISHKQETSSPMENEPSTQTPVLSLAQTSKPHNIIKNDETIKQEESEPEIVEETAQQDDEKTIEHETNKKKSIQDIPDEWLTDQPSTQSSQKLSIGINASGGLLASNNSQQMGRVSYDAYDPSSKTINGHNEIIDASDNTNIPYLMTKTVSEHHIPIRFGVSLNYQFSPRMALFSGISYTYLHSEFKIPLYSNVSYDQKLHYLGIPLGLSYQLWSASHFQLYLSGSVMLEKCLNEKPWQWSVDAAIGAEYNFIPQLGLYLEPSLGYYFKDGTPLEHYYKEHPLTPSIEFGLRLHLNK